MNLEQSRTLQQFGITLKESERYNTVSSLFGRTLAEHELQHNLKSYEREFLMDEAVSLPHAYHHINREFYSQETEHPLFNVKKQIDKRERDGVTLDGFERFEQMVMQAPNDMVSLWYSPDGPSGFPGVNFDSGRLYVNFKTGENESANFDIKVRPSFPILPLLGTISGQSGQARPGFDSPEQGKMYYLAHPIATGMDTNGFFSFMEQYAETETSPVYISRRDTSQYAARSLKSAIAEMKELFERYSAGGQLFAFEPPGDKTVGALMKEQDLLERYIAVIAPYIEKNNGSVTLYGCSTTSTVSRGDIQEIIASHSVSSLISQHSTQARLLTNRSPLPDTETGKSSFPCPKCGGAIPSGEGRTQCPHCGVTKDQYAKETGNQTCA